MIDPSFVDEVILGCRHNIGPRTGCMARNAWLAASQAERFPGVTSDLAAGSSQRRSTSRPKPVARGWCDLLAAGGVQNMSMIPMGKSVQVGVEKGLEVDRFRAWQGWVARYGDQPVNQFHGAKHIAQHWEVSSVEMERLAPQSHGRLMPATGEERFDNPIEPLGGLTGGEGARADTALEMVCGLQPHAPGGRLTAAVARRVSDAPSAVLIATRRVLDDHGGALLTRIHYASVVGRTRSAC